MDEITELRRRGNASDLLQRQTGFARKISAWRNALSGRRRVFFSRSPTMNWCGRCAGSRPIVTSSGSCCGPCCGSGGIPGRRVRALGHTVMGAALAEQLAPLDVEHIHAHHGYFASWMALAAARLLGIGFSFTLHGSDLLQRADLLSAKLRACQFCVTVSDFNRSIFSATIPPRPRRKSSCNVLGLIACFPGPHPAPHPRRADGSASACSPSDACIG